MMIMIESYYIIISKSVDDNDRSWKGTMTKPNYGTPDLGFIPDTHGATSFWNHYLRAQSHNSFLLIPGFA